jgi:DNA-binding winged helix-turn-helix (wHTH) protein
VLFVFDEFELDGRTPELRRDGAPVRADALALRLLLALVRNAGQVVTKQELIDQVWEGRAVSDNVVTVAMVRLRKALGQTRGGREFVANVHGRGYRFARQVEASEPELAPLLSLASSSTGGPPFVGREHVLERMHAQLNELRAGRGGACALSGEPGIGKTRAVEVLEGDANLAGLLVAWGYCRESGDTPPLWPCLQLARAVIARHPLKALAPQLGAAALELKRLLPELEHELGASPKAAFAGLPPDHSGAAKHRIFDALARLFALAAKRGPCVLVLDDLHRADAASLEFLRYLIDEIAHMRVLLLCTLREPHSELGARAQANLLHVLGHRNCERIPLTRLQEADVVSYVAATLDDPNQTLGRAVYKKSEGNPFYMVELARQLRSAAGHDAGLLALPHAALDLVRQRVAMLDGDARGVLSCASVIGRSFELGVLQDVTDAEPSALIASLDRAVRGQVVSGNGDSRTQFAFGHDLLRAALYDALPAAERRSLHLRVGKVLEQRQHTGEEVAAAELAYHFYAALPESDLRKTVRHCADAAWAAAAVHANADVVRHLRHALEALDLIKGGSLRLRISLMLRQALFAKVDSPPEFEQMIREILHFGNKHKSGIVLAYAALLVDPDAGFPPAMKARDALEQALRWLPESERGMRAAVTARLSLSVPLAYDAEASDRQIASALELSSDIDAHAILARHTALAAQLYLKGGPAHEPLATRLQGEIEALYREHPTTLTIPPALLEMHRSIVALQRGELAAMTSALERCGAQTRKVNHRELMWHSDRFALLARINAGELAQVRGQLDALHRRAEQERMPGTALFSLYDRTVVLGDATRWPEEIPPIDADDGPNLWSIRLRALIASGRHEQARASLYSVPAERLSRLPCDRDYLGTLGALARSALALDAREYFAPLYELLAPYPERFSSHVSFFCEGSVSELLGILARASGRSSEGAAHFNAAIEHSQRAGLPICTESARRELARGARYPLESREN